MSKTKERLLKNRSDLFLIRVLALLFFVFVVVILVLSICWLNLYEQVNDDETINATSLNFFKK